MLPELDIGRAVERVDEAAEDRTQHVRPHGSFLAEFVEAVQPAVNFLPIRLLAFEGHRGNAAFNGDEVLEVSGARAWC